MELESLPKVKETGTTEVNIGLAGKLKINRFLKPETMFYQKSRKEIVTDKLLGRANTVTDDK